MNSCQAYSNPQDDGVDRDYNTFEKFFKKVLAFLKTFMYNTACRHDIGLSPSGKALDSDSSISGVRIPQAQLETSRSHTGGFFVRVAMKIDVERQQSYLH